jgi:cytochrome P450
MIVLASIFLLGVTLIISIFLAWITRKKRSKYPVPKGYPIIGNGLDVKPSNLLKYAFINPAKYGPIYEFNVPGAPGFMVGDPDVMREIMMKRPKKIRRRNSDAYTSSVLGTTNGLFASAGTVWSHMRRATAPSFSLQNVKNKFYTIINELKDWMDRIREREGLVLDMRFESFSMTIRVITSVAFGLEPNDPTVSYFLSPQFLDDTNALFNFTGQYRLFPLPKFLWKFSSCYKYEVEAAKAADRFTDACEQLILYKQQLLKEGKVKEHAMIDLLIETETLSRPDLIANIKTFYMAGSETTSVSIAWTAFILSQYPEITMKVREEVEKKLIKGRKYQDIIDFVAYEAVAELKYCAAVGKEILRRFGSVPLLALEVEDLPGDVEITSDLHLRKGDLLWMNIEYANHHPDVFAPDPRVFRPERWLIDDAEKLAKMDGSFFTFGSGPRVCPGMNLALNEIIPAVALLGYYFDLDLACPANEIERVVNFTATANKMPMYAKFRYPDE